MRLAGLAFIIAFGIGTSIVSVSQAADLWTNLFNERLSQAEQGSSDAQFEIGAMYENGRGVELNRRSAMEWYNKAAQQGHSRAANALARIQDNERRFLKAQKLAEVDDLEGQYTLGTMYLTGTGVTLDLANAQLWLSRAAARGHTKAQFKLAHLYYVEMGDRADYKAAFEWFSKAAANDYAHAMYYLGELYTYGAGVRKDYVKAREWYTKASAAGFTPADKSLKELEEHIVDEKQRIAEAEAVTATTENITVAVTSAPAIEASPKTSTVKVATPPAPSKPVISPRDRLLQAQWHDGDSHAKFLPSQISQCKSRTNEVICYTKELARQNSPLERYRVKSIIRNFNAKGEFDIVYRELVLNSPLEEDGSMSKPEAGDVTPGWLAPHSLNCRLGDDSALTCTNDKGVIAQFKGV